MKGFKDAKSQVKNEARGEITKAMGHRTRLFTEDRTGEAPRRCVCELTAMVGCRHVHGIASSAMLKNAGIMEDGKRGGRFTTACGGSA